MAILTTINGMPLFSTPQEALSWGSQKGLVGYHTHIYNGQTGYMGGTSHGQASSSNSGSMSQNLTNNGTSSSGGY